MNTEMEYESVDPALGISAATTPALSVVVPTYNRSHLVQRAVRSVLAQTFGEYELIVVDDASDDDTQDVVQALGDARIRYIRHERNRGVGAARNTGVNTARSPWVIFLDSDDEMMPTLLERYHSVIASVPEDVGFVWCGIQRIKTVDGHQQVVARRIWSPTFDSREEAYRSFLKGVQFGAGNGFAVRARSFREVGGFDERLWNLEDADMLLRMSRHFDYRVIDDILINAHIHEGPNLNNVSPIKSAAFELMLDKYREDIQADPEAAHHFLFGLCSQYYVMKRFKRAFRYGVRALYARPTHRRTWILLSKAGLRYGAALLHGAGRGDAPEAR